MSEWRIFYRDQLDQDRTWAPLESEEAALERAKALHRERAELYRIEGPEGRVLPREEIMIWVAGHRY